MLMVLTRARVRARARPDAFFLHMTHFNQHCVVFGHGHGHEHGHELEQKDSVIKKYV